MNRRAATLVEVLVAIFVMGIGLIALLTLFPIGIISMAQAIQDERCFQCSQIADGLANALDVRHDPWVIRDWPQLAPAAPAAVIPNPAGVAGNNPPAYPAPYPTGNPGGNDPAIAPAQLLDAYTNPNPATLPNADALGPSYPLFVDPVGYYSSLPPTNTNWVGGATNVLARRRLSFTPFVTTLTQSTTNPYLPSLFQPGPPVGVPIVTPAYPPLATFNQFLPSPPYAGNTPTPIWAPTLSVDLITKNPITPAVPVYPQPYPYPPPAPVPSNAALLSSMFTLWDDVIYDGTNLGNANSVPAPPLALGVTPTVLRDTRYSWAYLCQRPQNGITLQNATSSSVLQTVNSSVVNLSIVVFSKRPLSLSTALSLPEYVYDGSPLTAAAAPPANPTYFDTTNNIITVDYTNYVPPPVRPGDWILDVTRAWTITPGTTAPFTGVLTPHAYFYRIVSVNEFTDTVPPYVGPRQLAQYEVQTPLRGWATEPNGVLPFFPIGTPLFPVYAPPKVGGVAQPPWTTAPPVGLIPQPVTTGGGVYLGFVGSSVILDGVARVYEMGPGRMK